MTRSWECAAKHARCRDSISGVVSSDSLGSSLRQFVQVTCHPESTPRCAGTQSFMRQRHGSVDPDEPVPVAGRIPVDEVELIAASQV